MNRPFIIPKSKEYDEKKTGFYSLKNSNFNNLRVQHSNIELDGIIRLNRDTNGEKVFEGFNGTKWVQFNALKGDTGDKGSDFNSKLELINCLNSDTDDNNLNKDGKGLIFKTTSVDTNQTTQIKIRSLSTKPNDYNKGQMKINSMRITTNDDEICLESLPQPYNWDISSLSIAEMKSSPQDDIIFKCYGDITTVKVKKGAKIERGQFVSLDEQDGFLVAKPYFNNGKLDHYSYPNSVFGVALESSQYMDKIKVCRDGITTVKYNSVVEMVDDNLMDIGKVSDIGSKGFLSNNGYVFCSPIKPGLGIDYNCVGEFLETDSNNNYYLFKINLQL